MGAKHVKEQAITESRPTIALATHCFKCLVGMTFSKIKSLPVHDSWAAHRPRYYACSVNEPLCVRGF